MEFSDYGILVAEIELPDNAKVYKDPEGNKWKADRFIIKQFSTFKDFLSDKNEAFRAAAIRKKDYFLQYMKEQPEKICLAAVKHNGFALKYVKKQTEKICLEAIKENFHALQCVTKKKQNEIYMFGSH